MNKIKFILTALCVICIVAAVNAQKVFVTKYKSEADIVVYISTYKSEADLVVYETTYKSDAKGCSGIWYYTKYKSEADIKIWFTKYK